jgi:hypothetical protein
MSLTWYVTPRVLQWMVFSPGQGGRELQQSRERAIERAKVLAREHGGGAVIVARRDGTIASTLPAANDAI